MPILDTSTVNSNASDIVPVASDSIIPKANEVVLFYGNNSNTAVVQLGVPWTNLNLNATANGKFQWQKVLTNAPVSVAYGVPGTQAWAVFLAAFGSNAAPVFTSVSNNNQASPFTSLINFVAGKNLIFVCELESNVSNAIPLTLTDSVGNTWVKVNDAVGTRLGPNGQLAQITMFYCQNCIGGVGITLSMAGNSGVVGVVWAVYQVDGLANVVTRPFGNMLAAGMG